MKAEIEGKWLDVDHEALRRRLRELDGVCERPETHMRRKNFDTPDRRLEKIGGWIRVRDENGQVTLSYKQLNERTLHGTKEVVVVVSDFDKACEFLADIGFQAKALQETKRETWKLNGVEVTLDTWPWIPPFVEIEAETEAQVRATAQALGLAWEKALFGSVEIAYRQYYDVSDAEIYNCPHVTFSPVPDWLEKRRHKKV